MSRISQYLFDLHRSSAAAAQTMWLNFLQCTFWIQTQSDTYFPFDIPACDSWPQSQRSSIIDWIVSTATSRMSVLTFLYHIRTRASQKCFNFLGFTVEEYGFQSHKNHYKYFICSAEKPEPLSQFDVLCLHRSRTEDTKPCDASARWSDPSTRLVKKYCIWKLWDMVCYTVYSV